MRHLIKSVHAAALLTLALASAAPAATVGSESFYRQEVQYSGGVLYTDALGNRVGGLGYYSEPYILVPPPGDGGNAIFQGRTTLTGGRDGLYPYEIAEVGIAFTTTVNEAPDRYLPSTKTLGLYIIQQLTFSATASVGGLWGSEPSFFVFTDDQRVQCVGPCQLALRNRITGAVVPSDFYITTGGYRLAPAPLPASSWLLGAAVLSAAALRRRRPA